MNKYPLAFKGPKGQIEQYFDEQQIYQALCFCLTEKYRWQYNEASQTSHLHWHNVSHTQLQWPIKKAVIGDCSCELQKPCIHLAVLTILCKAKLDQLPPFTNQLKQRQDFRLAFIHWLQRQHHDPFPNMARHRIIYLLTQTDNEQWCISIHKAYLTQDEQYVVKADLASGLFKHQHKPKFLSLTDQQIFSLLETQKGLDDVTSFILQDGDGYLLHAIQSTGRLMWRASYRPHIKHQVVSEPKGIRLIAGWYVSVNYDYIYQVKNSHSKKIEWLSQDLTPVIRISSHEQVFSWQTEVFRFHWAKIGFYQGDQYFELVDLLHGNIIADDLLDQVASWCVQIEKLPSIHSCYEFPIAHSFDVNDRSLGEDLTVHAPLLLLLKEYGWRVEFDDGFKLNKKKANAWYVNVTGQPSQSWFDLDLGVTIDGKPVNLLPYLVKALQASDYCPADHELTLCLDSGQYISLEHQTVKQVLEVLSELHDVTVLSKTDKLRLANNQLLRLNQLQATVPSLSDKRQWKGDFWFLDKAESLAKVTSLSEVIVPKGFTARLRNYQLTGVAWLQFLQRHHLGGLLADEMGLGKTIQILVHLLIIKNNGELKYPALIVTPTSLVNNWLAESQQFTPELSIIPLTGKEVRENQTHNQHHDVFIISYGTLTRHIEQFKNKHFHAVILDEAQAIKNRKTLNARVVKGLNSDFRVCLSGTPIENHLGELWSLFDFLMPGFLGSYRQFKNLYQLPIEKEHDAERLQALQKRVEVLMLRRCKAEVAKELPTKSEMMTLLSLGEKQQNLYESIRMTMVDEIKEVLQAGGNRQFIIGNALLRLRQICCHPGMLQLSSAESVPSVKIDWLNSVVPEMVESGRRILLFSSFTRALDLIEESLRVKNIRCLQLTGKTPASQRPKLVAQFQSGEADLFLISLKAGGVGLNLTAADTVIQFDPWWNPAAELQAADRAHRIGQDKHVFIYQLITKGTVEQKIYQMQQQKQHLAQGIWSQRSINDILKNESWKEIFEPM